MNKKNKWRERTEEGEIKMSIDWQNRDNAV